MGPVITTETGARRLGAGARGIAPWGTTVLEAGGRPRIEITATPCRHGSPGSAPIVGQVIGFSLKWEGQLHGSLWLSGDTVLFAGLRDVGRRIQVSTAVLNLGGVTFPWQSGPLRYTLDADEAIELCREINPRRRCCSGTPRAATPVIVVAGARQAMQDWSHSEDAPSSRELEIRARDLVSFAPYSAVVARGAPALRGYEVCRAGPCRWRGRGRTRSAVCRTARRCKRCCACNFVGQQAQGRKSRSGHGRRPQCCNGTRARVSTARPGEALRVAKPFQGGSDAGRSLTPPVCGRAAAGAACWGSGSGRASKQPAPPGPVGCLAPIRAPSAARIWWPPLSESRSLERRDSGSRDCPSFVNPGARLSSPRLLRRPAR